MSDPSDSLENSTLWGKRSLESLGDGAPDASRTELGHGESGAQVKRVKATEFEDDDEGEFEVEEEDMAPVGAAEQQQSAGGSASQGESQGPLRIPESGTTRQLDDGNDRGHSISHGGDDEDYVILNELSTGVLVSKGFDDAAAVAAHYNVLRKGLGRAARKTSVILNLRGLNNFLKSHLLSSTFEQRRQQGRSVSLLDLCGGKGGDLSKLVHAPISHYVLADIAEASVAEAIQRYNEGLPNAQPAHFKGPRRSGGYTFPAQFLAGDLTTLRLHYVLDPNITFDLVSCQFAFHYCFRDEASARRMLENVTDRLKPGGLFIATIPDANVLISRLRSARSASFGNSIYSVTFADPRLQGKKLKRVTEDGTLEDAGVGPTTSARPGSSSVYQHKSKSAEAYLDALRREITTGAKSVQFETNQESKFETAIQTLHDELDLLGISTEASDPYRPDQASKKTEDGDSANSKDEGDFWSSITFPASSPFGIRYNFFLQDAVDHVDEFLVHFPTLCALASQYGLLPVLHENFAALFANAVNPTTMTNPHLGKFLTQMKVFTDGKIAPDEWEAACLYCAIGFVKVERSDMPPGSLLCPPPDPADAGILPVTRPMETSWRQMKPEDLVVIPPEAAR